MAALEQSVRSVETDGLLWGACKSIMINFKKTSFSNTKSFVAKLVPLAYGIKKLQITCVVEDDKVILNDIVNRLKI